MPHGQPVPHKEPLSVPRRRAEAGLSTTRYLPDPTFDFWQLVQHERFWTLGNTGRCYICNGAGVRWLTRLAASSSPQSSWLRPDSAEPQPGLSEGGRRLWPARRPQSELVGVKVPDVPIQAHDSRPRRSVPLGLSLLGAGKLLLRSLVGLQMWKCSLRF